MTCNAASYKEGHTEYPLKPFTHWRQSWIQHGRLCWKSTVADTVNFVGGVYGAKATRSPVCTGLYCVLLTHSPTCECDRWQTRVSRAMTSGYVSIYEWTLNIYTLYCIVSEREYKSYIDVSLTRRCDLNHLRRRRPSMTRLRSSDRSTPLELLMDLPVNLMYWPCFTLFVRASADLDVFTSTYGLVLEDDYRPR